MGSEVQQFVNDVPQNYIPCQMGSYLIDTLSCSVPQFLFSGAFVLPRSCEEFSVFMLVADISGKLLTLYLQPMGVRLDFKPGRSSPPPPVCPVLNRSHEM